MRHYSKPSKEKEKKEELISPIKFILRGEGGVTPVLRFIVSRILLRAF